MDKLNVLIAGSTGYIGTQLVKLLCKHKNVKIKYLCGNTSVGKNISSYDKNLKKYKLPKIIKINYKLFKDVDVIFTSLPNGESQKIANKLLKKNIMIDLSADFRLKNPDTWEKWYGKNHSAKSLLSECVYGLPCTLRSRPLVVVVEVRAHVIQHQQQPIVYGPLPLQQRKDTEVGWSYY